MSHVVSMKVKVNNLAALRAACAELGLEFLEGQRNYKWYGQFVGDYTRQDAALRNGIDVKDYGRNASHVLAVKGNRDAYQVGVVAVGDAGEYQLVWDNWQGGRGLSAAIGAQGEKLQQSYAVHAATMALQAQGHVVTSRQRLKDGRLQLRAMVH